MAYLGYLFLRLLVAVFRLVPFWLLYGLSDMLAFLLYRVVGYRKNVVRANLQRAFPEKTPSEIEQIVRDTYRNLSDITLETVKGFSASLDELNRRCIWVHHETVNACLAAGQSVIITGAHYNTWEWPCFNVGSWLTGPTYVTYKPLSNTHVDKYYNRRRSQSGARMLPMEDTAATIRNNHNKEACVYFLINDQSPGNLKNAHWIDFFGVDTAFLPGPDFLARRYKYPVFYLNVQRTKRGYYKAIFEALAPDMTNVGEKDFTRLYAQKLEGIIREKPGNWLWSHKRWKHSRG